MIDDADRLAAWLATQCPRPLSGGHIFGCRLLDAETGAVILDFTRRKEDSYRAMRVAIARGLVVESVWGTGNNGFGNPRKKGQKRYAATDPADPAHAVVMFLVRQEPVPDVGKRLHLPPPPAQRPQTPPPAYRGDPFEGLV